MDYYIECYVSGGVTGKRSAILKENGKVKRFNTKEEAEAHASKLNKQMNNEHSKASFHYEVIS